MFSMPFHFDLIVPRLFGLVFAVDGAFVALFALHFDVERPLRTPDSDGKLARTRTACLHDEVRFEQRQNAMFDSGSVNADF